MCVCVWRLKVIKKPRPMCQVVVEIQPRLESVPQTHFSITRSLHTHTYTILYIYKIQIVFNAVWGARIYEV